MIEYTNKITALILPPFQLVMKIEMVARVIVLQSKSIFRKVCKR